MLTPLKCVCTKTFEQKLEVFFIGEFKMSRSYKPRGWYRRYVKDSYMQKMSDVWGSEFYHRRKDKTITKRVRSREHKRDRKEINEHINEI